MQGRHLSTGVTTGDSGALMLLPSVNYDGLTNAMFHMIRQNARGSTPVLMRMLEVLTAVADRERDPGRFETLHRHADLVVADAMRDIQTPGDIADVRKRHSTFTAMRLVGPSSQIGPNVVVDGRRDH